MTEEFSENERFEHSLFKLVPIELINDYCLKYSYGHYEVHMYGESGICGDWDEVISKGKSMREALEGVDKEKHERLGYFIRQIQRGAKK